MGKTYRAFQLVLLVSFLAYPADAAAEDVTVEGLLAKVPILSPDNEALTSFQFTAEMPTPFGFPAPMNVGWTRPDDFGMILVDPASCTPVVFIAEKRLLLYDTASATVWLADDAVPNFVLGVDDNKFVINYGFASNKKANVTIDLPSLFRDSQEPKLAKLDNRIWQMTLVSKSGNTKVLANFNAAQTWPLVDMEIRFAKDDSLLLAVKDISINGPVTERLRKFPSANHFPAELKVQRMAVEEVKGYADGLQVVIRLMRAVGGQAAIRNATVRDFPFFSNVDWDQAALADAKIAPALRSLLKGSPDYGQQNNRED